MLPSNPLSYTVEQLLPHTGSAILLDRFEAVGDGWIEASANHEKSFLYHDPDGKIPTWISIEYMVQTIGLFAGLRAFAQHKPVKSAFLLGTRSLTLHRDFFTAQEPVTIRAEMRYLDEMNMAMFSCTIRDLAGTVIAEAEIKAIQPDDINDILTRTLHG